MREIITLQLGQRSNYLATHFWNTQESYFTYSGREEAVVDHDIHFRAGLGADGADTFTPRTVIYDLKGGFGSLRKFNALYEIEDDSRATQRLWDGSTSSQQQLPIQPSRYQTLLDQGLPTFQLHDNDVKYWSDFNRVFYHPRSAVQLNQYELNSQIMPFEKWSAGEDLFHDLDKEVDILDRDVRPFAEECDHMQGFQIITGADDAWGGFASRYLDSLRDEYGKTSMWTWAIEDGSSTLQHVRSLCRSNSARSMSVLAPQSSAYVRLTTVPSATPNYVKLHSQSDWFTCALLCSAIESATLPSRLTSSSSRIPSLSLLEDTLNTSGNQRLFELQMSIDDKPKSSPASHTNGIVNGMSSNNMGEDMEMNSEDLDIVFSPGRSKSSSSTHVFAQLDTIRSKQEHLSAAESDPEERMKMRLNEETILDQYQTNVLFPMLDAFPDTLFSTSGHKSATALTTSLRTSSRLKDSVIQLRDESLRALALDERESLYNDLTELANAYSFGWESGSETEDD